MKVIILKRLRPLIRICIITLILVCVCALPALAITESDVENKVSAVGREAVTGSILIWFLCAVAFLKVSLKIDSFMSSLGVNVGHTGGSMLAEVMIAAKTVSSVASGAGRIFGGRSSGGTGASGAKGTDGFTGFLRGGLAGVVSRKITNDAVKTATSTKHTSAAHTATTTASHKGQATQTAQTVHSSRATQFEQSVQNSRDQTVHTDSATQSQTASHVASQTSAESVQSRQDQTIHTGSVTQSQTASHVSSQTAAEKNTSHTTHSESVTHRQGSSAAPTASPSAASTPRPTSIGAALFVSSLQKGGSFANRVIGRVAKGEIRSTGSITGDMAAQSLMSYMGYTALGEKSTEKVSFREVEIGGGRITGVEVTPEHPEGIAFGMYHADQYSRPDGDFTKIYSADGAPWYKQYAVDSVSKTPYKAPDGEIAYHSEIVKKLPQPPKRKDRM